MKKSSLFVFGVLLLLSISFIGCSNNHSKSKVVNIDWLYTNTLTTTKVSEQYRKLNLSNDGKTVTYTVKEKRRVFNDSTHMEELKDIDKTITGTYTLKGNKLTISFPEKKDDPVLNSVIGSFNGFYQFRVEGDYLILTSSIGMKEINWGFKFVKKDVLKDWAKS